jgi:molybdopterin synthase sulfur carrier subunit
MAINLKIPVPLRNLTANQAEVAVEGATVKEILEDLNRKHPGIKDRICDDSGNIRRFVNIYVNEEDIRFLKSGDTAVKDGDDISIIPAIAGGCF